MTNIGITGHQRIPAQALDYINRGIADCLGELPGPIVGYSSLALGADQLFAQAVLDAGGSLVAVIPCGGYEGTFAAEDLPGYHDLLSQASEQTILDFPQPSEAAYMAAGEQIMQQSDVVIAVWDGQPAAGLGGTGDAVAYARSIGKQVVVVWPEGVKR